MKNPDALEFARAVAGFVLSNVSSQVFFVVQESLADRDLSWTEVVEICRAVVAEVDARKRVLAAIKCAPPPKPKLSVAQAVVVDSMRNGWSLQRVQFARSQRDILQKGKPGGGGETRVVNHLTVWALVKRGIVRRASGPGFPRTVFELSDAWK
jgi:hypothetical protein